ncbi:DUF6357 family protein [Lentzea sp. BCCO 10_0798]|uniref:DUF6357 family protein n=1 Tax=Lentzea kristufekii TaxID=3095430 RepID=A0ABU4TR61_9PSEU|nr:DUF6357 family protein [Lentzea sp. BCCO 10_0798]MDX8050700.1 DUF6357 family protein [Lentzea sp. BCCO 10_0798]
MRVLTFSDDEDTEQQWRPSDPQPAVDAFLDFVARHRDAGNSSFCMEDEENEEALLFLFEIAAICRVKGAENPRTEYRVVTSRGDYRTQASHFVSGGFSALDLHGPWFPDAESFLRARSAHLSRRASRDAAREEVPDERGEALRSEFDESVLRRTHPRELRRRLEVLSRVDGHEPVTVDGVTHHGYGNGNGDTVNAWFTAAGRGLVVTFDGSSTLNRADDADAQAALYDGVPADLLALVRNAPDTTTTLNVPHPDGGTQVAATGVFTFSGPCAMAEGLVTCLRETRSGIEDTGVGRLLGDFLAARDFTPGAVAETVTWWSADDIAKGFAAAPERARSETAPLDREAVDRFCEIWADSGYNDRWDVHHVLFDSRTIEEAGEARDDLLSLVETLGLELVDTPPGAASGEVWVRTDPRIDAELGNWA